MRVVINKLTGINEARKCIESTVGAGFTAKCSLSQLYRWEHSPSRAVMFSIDMIDIPTFVSTHLVRHSATGQQHYVKSNRIDRGGNGDENRNTPVTHRMILNAQHLIDISKMRLCFKASTKTVGVWQLICTEMYNIDPELAVHLVPKCVYRGGICCEPKPCGQYNVRQYDPVAEELRMRHGNNNISK